MKHQRILGKVTESEEVKRRLGGESVVTEKKYQEMYAVLGLRCGVPQIARIKLIRKKFMDQLDLHVDFMASNQVDTYGSNRLYFLKF